MTKNTLFTIAGCLAAMSLASAAIAADHLDAPLVMVDPATDINDLYTFMDKDQVVLVATVFPLAVTDSKFSDAVQYIFHTTSAAAFGPAMTNRDIVCTFNAAQMVTCVLGAGPGMPVLAKVSGDASKDAGLSDNPDKPMMTVFTGLRQDPFFFNLDGFKKTIEIVTGALSMVPPAFALDAAGCPMLDAGTSTALVNQLKSDALGGPATNFFAKANGLAIVLKLDKSLIAVDGPIVSAWVSTNK